MPRVKRDILDDGIYHILNRGHNKDNLFKSADDFNTFKIIIKRYGEKFYFNLYHYCLMPNHFHLLIKVGRAKELPVIMKGICQSYAHHYKKSYNHSGYLFQNRYKTIHIDRDSYLLECARYIERNPLRANLVSDPSEYIWSSYNYYVKGVDDDIVTTSPLYETLAETPKERKEAYTRYVLEPRPYEQLLDEKIASLR